MKKWVAIVLILGLLVAHQDYWQWSRQDLVFGFVPGNMMYHIVISLVTAAVWVFVCLFCWPNELEQVAVNAIERDQSERETE